MEIYYCPKWQAKQIYWELRHLKYGYSKSQGADDWNREDSVCHLTIHENVKKYLFLTR